jgi:serine/threonine-protein kinase
MGLVFKARHTYLHTRHAVKVVLPDLVGNEPSLLTRFRQEAMAVAAVRHPNVVSVTDFGIARETMPFLVMELIEGKCLRDILAEEGRLGPERALEIMSAVGAGVGAAHQRGILHRDLKPLNIMIQNGVPVVEGVKVLDFGLAKIKSGDLTHSFVQAQTAGPMGSPYYMAPERWSDAEPDYHTDIYSLGVILYQMLAGDVPFKGASAASIMNKHLSQDPPSFSSMGLEVAPELEAVVRRALAKDPALRPASTAELVEELRNAVAYETLGRTQLGANVVVARASIQHQAAGVEVEREAPRASMKVTAEERRRSEQEATRYLPPLQSILRVEDSSVEREPQKTSVEDSNVFAQASSSAEIEESQVAIPSETSPQSVADKPELAGINVAQRIDPPSREAFLRPSFSLRRLAVVGIATIAILLSIGAALVFNYSRVSGPHAQTKQEVEDQPKAPHDSVRPRAELEMVEIAGGEFMMGRSDVPLETATAYDLNQWPAHRVAVDSFFIARNELTNAEYAEFVREKNYPAPEGWSNGNPPQGQESWPVRTVSHEDAEKFAAWRSELDGVVYRLPTEEEWEYAARGGGRNRLYPWGDRWVEGRATVEASAPTSAGVHSKGDAAPDDMIGNVWEWTASVVSIYPGNDYLNIPAAQKDFIVVRGGSYQSRARGAEAITATRRQWVPASTRQPHIGFRLARSGS